MVTLTHSTSALRSRTVARSVASRSPLEARAAYVQARELATLDVERAFLTKKIAAHNGLRYLSMGMSADYAIAIEFGATHVRIGSAIFGERT